MGKPNKKSQVYYSSDEEDFNNLQKHCGCNESDDVAINKLKNQLKEKESELAFVKEKLEIYQDKIKDKNDIIEALKSSNNLYKLEYKDKINSQAEQIKALNVELFQRSGKSLKNISDDHVEEKKQENNKLEAPYKAKLKEKDDQIMFLEMDLSLANLKIKEKDDLLKNQAESIENFKTKSN
ncbi:uncharacterized protein [Drosophila bipectinata]|uniref:uncharacterized protein n=1 Tax=Drosophila bipectinata TaxID=42026 RepID=UPI0038B25C74